MSAAKSRDEIWNVVETFLSDAGTEIIFVVCGNPSRPEGQFRRIWGADAWRWRRFKVDSRQVSFVNQLQLEDQIKAHAHDQDWIRVHITGDFPVTAANQLIRTEDVEASMRRAPGRGAREATVLGIDPAGEGQDGDAIAVVCRRGDEILFMQERHGLSTVQQEMWFVEAYHQYGCDFALIDAVGIGAGIATHLERSFGLNVIRVGGGETAEVRSDEPAFANRRTQCWWRMGRAIRKASRCRSTSNSRNNFAAPRSILIRVG